MGVELFDHVPEAVNHLAIRLQLAYERAKESGFEAGAEVGGRIHDIVDALTTSHPNPAVNILTGAAVDLERITITTVEGSLGMFNDYIRAHSDQLLQIGDGYVRGFTDNDLFAGVNPNAPEMVRLQFETRVLSGDITGDDLRQALDQGRLDAGVYRNAMELLSPRMVEHGRLVDENRHMQELARQQYLVQQRQMGIER